MKSNVPDFHSGQMPQDRGRTNTALVFLSLLVGILVVVFTFARLDRSSSPSYAAASATQLGVYAGGGQGDLYKLDAANGTFLWRFQTAGRLIPAPAAVAAGVVYVGSSDSNVYALSATDGAKFWQFATGGSIVSSPVVDGGVLYVGSSDGNMYALDAANGGMLWAYFAGQDNQIVSVNTAAVDQGVVYGSSSDNISHSYLFALDAKTGKQLWRTQVADQLFTSPQVVKGVIYIASSALSQQGGQTVTDSFVYAYNAGDGSLLWRSAKVKDFILGTPTVVDGSVYFGSRDNHVYALHADKGTQLWSHRAGGAVYASPQVVNGVVYVGVVSGNKTNNAIQALNATDGSLRWQHTVANYAGANLVVNGSVLYVGSSDSVVYALKTSDGSHVWSHQDTAPFTNAPLTVGP